jgi:predicted nuclease of predicted toxin-antitoxin system
MKIGSFPVPDPLTVLVDQNIPRSVAAWLAKKRVSWEVYHTSDADLDGAPDSEIFEWAQERDAIILTFDEDFADQRVFPLGEHAGVIRLRVWPTTVEETQSALTRLLEAVDDSELRDALVIVGRTNIRVRSP